MSDILRGLKCMDEACPDYDKAERYYDGTTPEFFASPRLRAALSRTGTTFRLNFAKTPVNVLANRLEIASVTSPQEGVTNTLAKIWQYNKLDIEATDIHHKTGEYGDAYVIVWPDPDDPSQVNIDYNNPKECRIVYSTENPRLKKFMIKRWMDEDTDKIRVNLYYADRIERYILKEKTSKGDQDSDWLPYTDESDGLTLEGDRAWPIPNPFGEIPGFHFRTDRPYGVPDHKDAYGAQDAINKLTITQMSTIDYLAAPQRWALEDPAQTETGDDFSDYDPIADLDETGEALDHSNKSTGSESDLSSEPGGLWWLRNTKSVGQFSAADADNFIKPFELYVRSMAQVCDTALHYFDPTGDAPSGESLRAADAPLNERARRRRLILGATHQEMFVFALKCLGITDAEVNIAWIPPAVIEDKDGWTAIWTKISCGVPRRQAFLDAGYTPDQVDSWGITDMIPEPATDATVPAVPPTNQPAQPVDEPASVPAA